MANRCSLCVNCRPTLHARLAGCQARFATGRADRAPLVSRRVILPEAGHMSDDIEIRQSTISGRGVFARRQFRKGETVLRWDVSRKIRRDRIDSLSSEEHHFLNPFDNTFFVLLGEPERYVNHSCANNTRVEQFTDVAVRDILRGEEITSDYRSGGSAVDFVCRCGAPNCRNA